MDKDKWATLILTFFVAPIVTFTINELVSLSLHQEEQSEVWSNQVDQLCYASSFNDTNHVEVKGYKVKSKTCPSGNTFLSVIGPDGSQRIEWLTVDKLIDSVVEHQVRNIPPAHASEIVYSRTEGDFIHLVIKTESSCHKQIINVKSGKIVETREVECGDYGS